MSIHRQIGNEIILQDQQNIDTLINDRITDLNRKGQAVMKLKLV